MTDRDSLARINQLPAEKRALLLKALQKKKVAKEESSGAIARRADNHQLPLSFSQQRLWFLHQLEKESPAYNMPTALELKGTLDIGVLERCLQEILTRHEVLRTRFVNHNEQPYQVIDPEPQSSIPLIDLSGLEKTLSGSLALELAGIEARGPFDLANGPLLRTVLLRHNTETHTLLFNLHHIVTDGWSTGVLVKELTALYEAFRTGKPSPLSPLPIQYADFSVWQRNYLQGKVLENQITYWKKHFGGEPPTLALPTDFPRPAVRDMSSETRSINLSPELTARLEDLAKQEEISMFMLLLAAFQIQLHRYTGQAEISVGSPVAGRNQRQTEPLIGLFVNTLVLFSRLDGNPTVRAMLQRVKEITLDAFAHQDVPFEKLVEELQPKRALTHTPLFQVMFVLQNVPKSSLQLPGLSFRSLPSGDRAAKFDLHLIAVQQNDRIYLSLQFPTDLFRGETAERMLGHLRTILEAIADFPGQRIGQLPMLAREEKENLLVRWSGDQGLFEQDKSLVRFFEEQAARNPEAIALRASLEAEQDTETITLEDVTYQVLNQRANHLARILMERGAGPEVRIGIAMDRVAGMVVAILGVLKSGSAYVPLEPNAPSERFAFIAGDAQLKVMITQAGHAAEIRLPDIPMIQVDPAGSLPEHPRGEHLANPSLTIEALSTAYVIYTSGSTGRPKGVAVSHRCMTRLFTAIQPWYQFGADDTWSLFHSYAFDVSVCELWGALANGGRLIVIPYWVSRSAIHFYRMLKDERVTVLSQTPSAFSQLMAVEPEIDEQDLIDPRLVIFGGEALDIPGLLPWFQRHGDQKPVLVNMYGITETTVHTTYRPVSIEDTQHARSLIGVPIPDLKCYVLDPYLEPAPMGMPGEIHVAGPGLARGYLDRPGLTAQRFIPNPFAKKPEDPDRLYKSGDLARYLPPTEKQPAEMEYLGRRDNQVKIRGFRIELGEIQAAISNLSQVRDSVVAVRERGSLGRQIIAWLVPTTRTPDLTEKLREALRSDLPEYMIPSALVILDSFPLTINGKIDKRALPDPDPVSSSVAFEEPRTMTEDVLSGIWADVLGLERVGIKHDFFALGGHSLLATQVISRIRGSLSVEVPLRELFLKSRLDNFARVVDDVRLQMSGLEVDPIVPRPRVQAEETGRISDLPLSFAQTRLWFIDQLQQGDISYNMPLALELEGSLDLPALNRSLEALIERHEPLRTTFLDQGGTPVQVIMPTASVKIPLIDLTGLSQSERQESVRRIADAEARRAFDLARGPLMRFYLLKMDTQLHAGLMTLHHILSDGWSMGILIRELSQLYSAFHQGDPSPLPPLPIQYADFSYWQQQHLQGEILEKHLDYWKKQLPEDLPVLDFPTDYPRSTTQESPAGNVSQFLNETLSAKINALTRQERVTLFMILLAAFKITLQQHTGQNRICIGSPIAGRNRVEIEGLIGLFVNNLVLYSDLSEGPSFLKFLEQVRNATLEAYAHQDLPFEKLVEEIQPDRDLMRAPLFQAMLIVQNTPSETLDLPGLTLRRLPTRVQNAKFDLTLNGVHIGERIALSLEYNAALWRESTIARFLQRLERLLDLATEDPERSISSYNLLDEEEQRRLIHDWNHTQTDFVPTQTIHQIFAEMAGKIPDRPAFYGQNEQLTFARLAEQATRIAAQLQARGVGPGGLVGIGLPRDTAMMAALLGVLEAGAAFVPMEPGLPSERLRFIAEDARIQVLITNASLGEHMPEGPFHLYLDDLDSSAPHEFVAPSITPDYPAYAIYTSGSTGVPKGVLSTHASVLNRLNWMWQTYPFKENEVCCQKTALSFVDSIWECFGPLLKGIPSVIAHDDVIKDNQALFALLERYGVTRFALVPSLLRVLMQTEQEKGLASLRFWSTSGETLPLDLFRTFRETFPDTTLVNLYGSSEVSADVACYQTSQELETTSVPIGFPVHNTKIYLANARLALVPMGYPGEILVAGANLASGYLYRPTLTAERFVPNPYSKEPGQRVFRTGDLARHLSDGNLIFLGRRDHQVKIRGVRVEIGEVEIAANSHDSVRHCAIIAAQEKSGLLSLIAFIESDSDNFSISAFREHLESKLPETMVPTRFILIEEMPMTPSGKISRGELKALTDHGPNQSISYKAPTNPEEELIASIWSDILGIEQVGVTDHFFEIGGHSLLATQVISRINKTFSVNLPLRLIFETPTVTGLAKQVEKERIEPGELPDLPVPVPRNQSLPLSYPQHQIWLFEQINPGTNVYNLPFSIRINGPLDLIAFEKAFADVIQRHEILRTTFALESGSPTQVIHENFSIDLTHIDIRGILENKREALADEILAIEYRKPFNLETGPLMRSLLIQLGPERHITLVTLHHIVFDGWSRGVLIRELATLYEDHRNQRQPLLPRPPIQYADYAVWQRRWLEGGAMKEQLKYWKEWLQDHPPEPILPLDHPRPKVQTSSGKIHGFALPETLTQALLELSRAQGLTLYMSLLTGFQVLLHGYSSQERFLIGTPIAGRNREETEDLIGLFVNMLVLKADLTDDPRVCDLLERVRAIVVDAFSYQDLPFDYLVSELGFARRADRTPLSQVGFDFHNQPTANIDLSQITLQVKGLERNTAKTDLVLFMRREGERIFGFFEYNSDLFESTTIESMGIHLTNVLEQMTNKPEQRLTTLMAQSPSITAKRPTKKSLDLYQDSNLSLNQLLIWVAQKMQPDKPIYNRAVRIDIFGNVDADAFQQAYQTLVNSSDALRTIIEEPRGVPMQRVLDHFEVPFAFIDFSEEQDTDAAVDAYIDEQTAIPFDLTKPMLFFALLKTAEDRFTWYFNHHNLIADATSNALVFTWMADFYERALAGTLPESVSLPKFQAYLDYESEYRHSRRYKRVETYWHRLIEEELERMTFYGVEGKSHITPGTRTGVYLDEERMEKLDQLVTRDGPPIGGEELTKLAIFSTTLYTYLYRLSGIRRLSIGVALHSRTTKAFAEAIGLCMQVVPIRVTIQDNETFASLCKAVVREILGTLKNLPYALKYAIHQKPYHALINYVPGKLPLFGGMDAETMRIHQGNQDEHLAIHVHQFSTRQGIVMEFDLDQEVFDEERGTQTIAHFNQLLDAYLEKPDTPLDQEDLMWMDAQRDQKQALEEELILDFDL